MEGMYVLKDKVPVPTKDVIGWGEQFNRQNIRVALDKFGDVTVSTVFLGLDYSFGDGVPLLFETMAFFDETGWEDQYCERCSTWDEAVAQHKRVVEMFKAQACGGI